MIASGKRIPLLCFLLALPAGLVLSAARADAQGTGVYAEYFDNLDFAPSANDVTRLDAAINFDFGDLPATPGPDAALFPAAPFGPDQYSIRWSGVVQAPAGGSGVYYFRSRADDGIRVWIDGSLLLDRWRDQSVTNAVGATIALTAGQRYSIRVEYFENPGYSVAQLEWLVPGAGGYAIVPQAALYPIVAAPKISPAAGTYSDSVTATIACDTFGTEIRYTTNGVDPTAASTLYTGPFVLAANTTVKAFARRPGTLLADSPIATSVFTVNDILRPSIVTAQTPTSTQVVVVFSEAVDLATSQTFGNYTMSGGVTVSAAVLSGDLRTVFLTTSAMTPGTGYVLGVSNVTDRSAPPKAIAGGSGIAFVFPNFPSASLTNYYPFEEGAGGTTADLEPTAPNNGTLAGASGPPAWIIGAVGRALSFDGVDDSVTLAADLQPVLGGTATLACWVRTTGQGNLPVRAPGIAGGIIAANATNTNDILWGWLDESGRIGITAGLTIDFASNPEPVPPNAQPNTAQSAQPINDGQWHHIALTRDSGTGAVQVWVDGLLSGSATAETGVKTAVITSLGRITGAVGSAGHPVTFLGDLDDVRIFNSVLTQAEIQSFANTPPKANAGPDRSVELGQGVSLNGTAIDDGFPSPSTITALWTGSGPGAVAFGTPNQLTTTATFTTAGIYVLRLTASDGQLATSDEVIVSYGLITVTPLSLQTTEAGAQATFSVVLNGAPLAIVTIPVSSSNTAEGTVSTASLVFAAAGVPQIVTVTGVDDSIFDRNQTYLAVLGPAVSTDPAYSGFNASDVSVVNVDDDLPPPPTEVWGNCGLLGVEGLIPLLLIALAARRRRARSAP